MNKAQVSVSTAARQTGHLCFQVVISFSDRRKPNLSNRLVGACTAGMASSEDLEIADSGCLKKLARASPTVAEQGQSSGSHKQRIDLTYLKVETHERVPN